MSLSPFLYDDFYQLTTPPPAGTPPPAPRAVTMDLIFGSLGQSADYTVTLDTTTLFQDEKDSHKNIPLGDTASLAGKTLKVVGNILDMPGTDNKLTLDFNIKGGVSPLTKPYSVTATTGDAVDISLIVQFI